MNVCLAPSILSADFAALGDAVRAVEQGGAHWIHVDVMDGHFVPNLTIGPIVVRSLRRATRMPLDVHLMIEDADRYIPAFAEAGADILTVHAEACVHLDRTIDLIRRSGARPGVALNPATPVSAIENILPLVDLVLVMTVNPGFAGQSFIPYCVEKVRTVSIMCKSKGLATVIEVDGGIDLGTIEPVVRAGARVLVAGNAIFGKGDPTRNVMEMLELTRRLGYDSGCV